MVSPPWLISLTGEKGRPRAFYTKPCLTTLIGLVAVSFLLYSMSSLFFGSSISVHKPGVLHIPHDGPAYLHDNAVYQFAGAKVMPVLQPESSNSISWDYDRYNKKKDFGDRPSQKFHSSDIKTPFFQVNTFKPRATEGHPYLFYTPAIDGQKAGVQVFSREDLSLVYDHHGFHSTNNFRAQEFNGEQYLTFWEGVPATGHGLGTGVLYNQNYELAHNISINVFDSRADSHEFELTHDGGALFSIYEEVKPYDMTPIGGPKDGVLQDSAFEEVDIITGKTRFSWRASDHFSIEEATVGYNDDSDYGHPTHEGGWDFFHINSLEKTKDGNYLVSGRRLNLLTLIDGKTGKPIWQLGGKNNQYKDLSGGTATNFAFQHHARFDNEAQTEIVLFDNAQLVNNEPNPGCEKECSRGLALRLDHKEKTAEVIRSYYHPLSVQARAEGSAERQSNGNILVGWGKVPGFTEYSRDGEVLLDVQTGPFNKEEGGFSHVYRIYSMDWKGAPTWDPAIALFEGNVYVSWNGATEQKYWVLYTGDSKAEMKHQYVVYRGGFETKLSLPHKTPAWARVAALDRDGKLLGSTDFVDLKTGETSKAATPISVSFSLDPNTIR